AQRVYRRAPAGVLVECKTMKAEKVYLSRQLVDHDALLPHGPLRAGAISGSTPAGLALSRSGRGTGRRLSCRAGKRRWGAREGHRDVRIGIDVARCRFRGANNPSQTGAPHARRPHPAVVAEVESRES